MFHSHNFLEDLALVLCIAAATTVIFQRLRQPVVVGYLVAGMIVGPHVPAPLFADQGRIQILSELGVILLIFSIGLEFSLRKLARIAPTAGFITVVQVSLMMWLGYVVGQWSGWTELESLYAGALVAISSTTIVAKAFSEERVGPKLKEIVFGVLLFEDLVAILLLAILTALSAGGGLSLASLGATAGRLGAFLGGLTIVALLVVPPTIRSVARLKRNETLLVAAVGICFACAFAAERFGYSVALGAFLAGSVIAQAGVASRVEHLVEPVRDLFGSVFFVSVGMLINPALIVQHWVVVVVLTAVVVIGKIAGVSFGAFLIGDGIPAAVQAGMSLAQIGEFSFIIAGLGLAMGATGDFLYTVAVAVSAITTFLTPFMIRASRPAAELVDRALPRKLQLFAALYGSWMERLRNAADGCGGWSEIRRPVYLAVLDVALLAAVVIGFSFVEPDLYAWVETSSGFPLWLTDALIVGAFLALSTPFYAGLLLLARTLGRRLAARAFAQPAHEPDPADASRRMLAITLQLAIILVVAAPLLVLTQPFFPPLDGAAFVEIAIGLITVMLWRSAGGSQNQVRLGTTRLLRALAAGQPGAESEPGEEDMQTVPGIGWVLPVRVIEGDHAVGKTLAKLNLRGLTGATVLAITRGAEEMLIPTGSQALMAGDMIALAGSQEAIEAARKILSPRHRQ